MVLSYPAVLCWIAYEDACTRRVESILASVLDECRPELVIVHFRDFAVLQSSVHTLKSRLDAPFLSVLT